MTLRDAAILYLRAGLCVLPARREEKRPAVLSWQAFQSQRPSDEQVNAMFPDTGGPNALCIVAGAVSGNLELIDFDHGAEWYDQWREHVEAVAPGLIARLTIESSQRGGLHVIYRCTDAISGNVKLAERRGDDGRWQTMIETRGEGGLFLCAPSEGYTLHQGTIEGVQIITGEERDTLLTAAWSMTQRHQEEWPVLPPLAEAPAAASGLPGVPGVRPGDEFNATGDVVGLLHRSGWTRVKDGENQYWRRPGKSSGWSATLKDRVFYVHSSSAAPLESGRAYSPFALLTTLEHGGDWKRAAASLRPPGSSPGIPTGSFSASVDDDATDCPSAASEATAVWMPRRVREVLLSHTGLREPVVHGLLRRGETMNVISAPKMGKSWTVLDLALSIVTGRPWLDTFETFPGNVLLLDNELHEETTGHRIPMVASARGIATDAYADRLWVINLRGKLMDVHRCLMNLLSYEGPRYDVIIFDAFYRFVPPNTDENDNGAMAEIYNALDKMSDEMGCAVVLVHHSSKGMQGGKSVTDVGAGAGSMSRAADTHLVLRQHEDDGVIVLDAATRSWPPPDARCLRWKFPVWHQAPELDPKKLRSDRPRKNGSGGSKKPETVASATHDDVLLAAFGSEARSRRDLMVSATQAGLTEIEAKRAIASATNRGVIVEVFGKRFAPADRNHPAWHIKGTTKGNTNPFGRAPS